MCAVTNGYVDNSEDWSSRVGIILHYWHLKQKLIGGTYNGSFDITLFMGTHKLNCHYDHKVNSYEFQKFNIEDPELLFNFFSELATILDMEIKNILLYVKNGPWMLVDDKIIKTNGDGFMLIEMDQISPISFSGCSLLIDNDWTRLVDSEGYRIFNVETGLLASEYIPNDEYSFRVFGLEFNDICKIGAFNQNFNILYKSRSESLRLLNDLDVNKPFVTEITKKRLNLSGDWNERKIESVVDDITIEDKTDIVSELMNADFTIDDFKELISQPQEDDLKDMVDFLINTDIIYSMKTTQKVQHTRKIFSIVSHLKYDLIVRNLLFDMKINKQVITSIGSLIRSKDRSNIMSSLISYYDRVYQTDSLRSPKGIFLDIDYEFIRKFEVYSPLTEEEIKID
jgi:hypothetical protein